MWREGRGDPLIFVGHSSGLVSTDPDPAGTTRGRFLIHAWAKRRALLLKHRAGAVEFVCPSVQILDEIPA
jgi:hypothetical protein